MQSFPTLEDYMKAGWGAGMQDFAFPHPPETEPPLDGLLGEAAEYKDGGIFERVSKRSKKSPQVSDDTAVQGPLTADQIKTNRMNQTFSSYKQAMNELRAAKQAYDNNPSDTVLESLYNEKDAMAQQYEQEMADVGWKINVPSWGQVVDKQDYIIYQNEKDMENKVGGRPIYSAVGVPGYLWGYR